MDESSYHPMFQPDSLAHIAETVGVNNLPKDLNLLLCEDVTYRLRDVIFRCRQLARHSKRDKILASDVCNVLTKCGFGPVLPVNEYSDNCEVIDLLSQADELIDKNNQLPLKLTKPKVSLVTMQLVDLSVTSTTPSAPLVNDTVLSSGSTNTSNNLATTATVATEISIKTEAEDVHMNG